MLFLFMITAVESDAIPLPIRPRSPRSPRSFHYPHMLTSPTLRRAFVPSRMLALLPRNHESQYGGHDLNYEGEGYKGEEGTRDNSRERQKEDSYDVEEETEGIGMSRGHRHSSLGTDDWDEGSSKTRDSFREGSKDERFGPHPNGSPGDSGVDRFPSGSPYATTNDEASLEHNHPVSGSTQDTSELDEVPNSPQMDPAGDQPHEPGPAPDQGLGPSPEESTISEHAVSPSLTNGDNSKACSALSRLYRRLDGPAWHNQNGWKDTMTPHRIRTRNHEGLREGQHPFKTSGQMEEGTIDGQEEGHGNEGSTDRGTTSDGNDSQMELKEDHSGPPCCSWFGVTCRGGKVVGLALAGNGLDGRYPTEIVQNLIDLETL